MKHLHSTDARRFVLITSDVRRDRVPLHAVTENERRRSSPAFVVINASFEHERRKCIIIGPFAGILPAMQWHRLFKTAYKLREGFSLQESGVFAASREENDLICPDVTPSFCPCHEGDAVTVGKQLPLHATLAKRDSERFARRYVRLAADNRIAL